MSTSSRLSRLERRIPKLPCECECGSISKPLRVVHVGDNEPEPSAWRCYRCGRTELLITVKYLAEELWEQLLP